MNFWKLLFGFVPVYKWRLLFYILLNVLYSVVSVIGFSAIIPLLNILFGLSAPDIQMMPWSDIDSFSSLFDILKNNVLFFLQEQIIRNGTVSALMIVCSFLIATSFLSNAVSYYAYYVRIPIRTGISRDLRMRIYDKLITLTSASYKSERKGDFVGRMTTDIEEVDYGISTAMDMLIENPVQIIVYLVTLFGISVSLASCSTALLLLACTIAVFIGHFMKSISLKGQWLKGRLISMYEETIEKNTIIHVFSLRNYFHDKFHQQNEILRNTHNKMNRVHSIAVPLSEFMSTVVMGIVLFIGGSQIANGSSNIDAATLIYFVVIFHSIIRPTRSVVKATYGIRKAMASLERMEHILNIRINDNKSTEDTPINIGEGSCIEFKNLKFSYGDGYNIFDDFNCKIPIEESCAILGQNGKGKTTLARLLLKLEDNYEGDILIGGTNIKSVPDTILRSFFSYVPQESLLFNDTIFNNILVGNPDATKDDVYKAANLVGIHNYILSTENGYDSVIGEQGMNLSGGQRQCISIARALLKEAPIMILDEATSGVDKETEKQIIENISTLMQGKTLIVISHSPSIIDGISNHIYL